MGLDVVLLVGADLYTTTLPVSSADYTCQASAGSSSAEMFHYFGIMDASMMRLSIMEGASEC